MTLQEQLMEDMKTAMKAGDKERLTIIRLVLSKIKNFEIDHGQADDAAVQKIIGTLVKQQLDALTDFKRAERQDLIDESQTQLEILQSYLPAQLDDQQLTAMIQEVLSEQESRDFGPVMKAVMAKVAGQADGSRVASLLKQALQA